MPLGSTGTSYSYASTGKLVNSGKTNKKIVNESYGPGDVIGISMRFKGYKPVWLRKNNRDELGDSFYTNRVMNDPDSKVE